MSTRFELFELTHTERAAIRDAAAAGVVRAIDNRADGAADCDALDDTRRTGERIADGFALLHADGAE
ncbi:MAG: hypothetical protein ACYST6_10555 [Planctomycetota bacterium]|jgi:hypothetical protein